VASAAVPAAAAATSAVAPKKHTASELPPGRSEQPTVAEWAGQKKEVSVKGSSALKCETKMVREYLRVSCHGKTDTGGTPTAIKVTKGGREALAFANADAKIASLIVPFVEGTRVEATISWTDKSYPLKLEWPKGSKMPVVLGSFEGAKSPLDGSATSDGKKLCACHKKLGGVDNCDELIGEPDPDCDRTYANDCEKLLLCSAGNPDAPPSCLPGLVSTWPAGKCRKTCKETKDCPPELTCEDTIDHTKVCERN
jgi:hypothetical protein